MAVNKVELSDNTTLIDLTGDTGNNNNIVAGTVIHTASGEQITGNNPNINDTTEDVTPTANRIMPSYKVWVNGNELTGTMSNYSNYGINDETRLGPFTYGITDKTYNDYIPTGYHYHSRVTIATAEKNKIIAENIKQDVNILGITGSFSGFTKYLYGTFTGTAISNDPLTLNAGFIPRLVIVYPSNAVINSERSIYYYTFLACYWSESGEKVCDVAKFLSTNSSSAGRSGLSESHWSRSGNTCTWSLTSLDLRFPAVTYKYYIWG